MSSTPEKRSFHLYIRMDCSIEDGGAAELCFQRFHKELVVGFPDADIRTRQYDHVLHYDGDKKQNVRSYHKYGGGE